MITIKEWMELVDYKITEGGNYNLFSADAYALSSWNGDQDGYSLEIIFDTTTQIVYCVEACDYKHQRAYRLLHPDYKDEDPAAEAWDNINWCDLESDDDFIQKALAIRAGEDYDTRVEISVNLPDDVILQAAMAAHKLDITLNDYINRALADMVDQIKTGQYTPADAQDFLASQDC
jgi:hypothetical protein